MSIIEAPVVKTPTVVPVEPEQKPEDVLELAASILEREGWIQGYAHRDGRYCAWGAITVAAGGRYDSVDDFRLLEAPSEGLVQHAAILLETYLNDREIATWNDESGRTKQEVVDALRLAAKLRQRARHGS